MTQNNSNPGEKMFSLKEAELLTLTHIQQRNNDALLDFLSFISLERLAYPVSEHTRFRMGEDGELYISENTPLDESKVETA